MHYLLLLLCLPVLAEINFQPIQRYDSDFQFFDGSKRNIQILDFGKIKKKDTPVFGIGSGMYSSEMMDAIKSGDWLPKNFPAGLLTEVRVTCSPIRNFDDNHFKVYSPSDVDVAKGASLEYKVDLPCHMEINKFKSKLKELGKVLLLPSSQEAQNCGPNNKSLECKQLESVTKILSGDSEVGMIGYCGMEIHAGGIWATPKSLTQSQIKEEQFKKTMAEYVEGLVNDSQYKVLWGGWNVHKSKKAEWLAYKNKLKQMYSDLVKYSKVTYDPKTQSEVYGKMKLKDGRNLYQFEMDIRKECGKVSGGQDASDGCKNKIWKENYGVHDPGYVRKLIDYIEEDPDRKTIELRRQHSLKPTQYLSSEGKIEEYSKDCIFDEEAVVEICDY